MSDRDRRLRPDRAGIALPLAESPHVADGGLRRLHRLDGADVDLRLRLRAAARQQRQNDDEPERRPQEESQHDPFPWSPRLLFAALERTLAARLEMPVGRSPLFFPIFDAN